MQHNHNTNGVTTMPLLFLILGLLASCDCMQRIQGYVIDAQTGEPLSEVFYSRDTLLTTEEKQYDSNDTLHIYQRRTDSTGWFMDWRLANGFNCKPPLVLWLDKEGYELVRLESSRYKGLDTLVVKLHKRGSR